MKRTRAFTLLEVLVALVVVALALLALARTAALSVRDFDALRERTLAGWVAADVLADTRLATRFPPTGTSDGRVTLAGRDWRWRRAVVATPNAAIRRIDIDVYAGDDATALVHLSGFGSAELQ
ncbi:MAG: type II secretion system minor pseudopilin GspI [Lysobacterales bacterium]